MSEILGHEQHITREALVTRVLRRARLERFAALLDAHQGDLQLLSRREYVPRAERELLSVSNSPITVAYLDPTFRAEGIAGDRLGDAMRFFALTVSEAHHLFCDCHYGSHSIAPHHVALRARQIADKRTLGERWQQLCGAADRTWQRVMAMG